MLQPNLLIAKQRHAELLREAQNVRLANQARQEAGNQPLISRMAVLLSRLGKRVGSPTEQPNASLTQPGLACAEPH